MPTADLYWPNSGAAVAYWLGRGFQDRNENFESELDSRWWILFGKFEIHSKSCTITAVIIYCCYLVTPSRQQPKYALGASGPLAMGINKKIKKARDSSRLRGGSYGLLWFASPTFDSGFKLDVNNLRFSFAQMEINWEKFQRTFPELRVKLTVNQIYHY